MNIARDEAFAGLSGLKYLDLRFSDIRGKWQHITFSAERLKDSYDKHGGVCFSPSAIAGWGNEVGRELFLRPDLKTLHMDESLGEGVAAVICDVEDTLALGLPFDRDPRCIAKRTEAWLRDTGIADTALIGPELEFFVFENVRSSVQINRAGYEIEETEGLQNSGREGENKGHRPAFYTHHLETPPVDGLWALRSNIFEALKRGGLKVTHHHHEAAPSQCEIGIDPEALTAAADAVQKYKYIVRTTCAKWSKTASFMPKPLNTAAGSGLHVNLSLWKDGKPLFSDPDGEGISDMCRFFIGGVLRHMKSLNAITNASTNSYRRMDAVFRVAEAVGWGFGNRSLAIRIPHSPDRRNVRIEMRFPDPSANPYLCFSALMAAGVDGIRHRTEPPTPCGQDLAAWRPPLPAAGVRERISRDLLDAVDALGNDCAYLMDDGLFHAR